jgi:hypothetical protein
MPDDCMIENNEMMRMWKEPIMRYFKLLSQNFPGSYGGKPQKSQLGESNVLTEIQTKYLPNTNQKCYP